MVLHSESGEPVDAGTRGTRDLVQLKAVQLDEAEHHSYLVDARGYQDVSRQEQNNTFRHLSYLIPNQ